MKKGLFLTLVIALLLSLCACSGKADSQDFLDIRAGYLASDVSLKGEVSVDYGDRQYEYTLAYEGDGRKGRLEVFSPDIISDIAVEIDENKKVSLICEDIIIDTGAVYGNGYSPIEAIPLIVNAVREGYVSSIYKEKIDGEEYIAAEIDETPAGDDEKTIYTVWFSMSDKSIYKAEISINGFVVISVNFEEV